ncbi:MAG: SCO family protein [Planctomycetes bacterium]|nr:SCO family protein [Planctomycetota bacterium]MBI3833317.1 SCO family protein [Planctomycetota bacterium]
MNQANPITDDSLLNAAPANAGSASRWMMIAAGLAIVAAVAVFAMSGVARSAVADAKLLPAAESPMVPPFSLIDSTGKTVTHEDLLGKVWVADFIFAGCGGPCPTITQNLQYVGMALKNEKDARFVTFTLDPKNDTPDVLADYGRRFQADPANWFFLTSKSESAMHELVEKGFLQTVQAATANAPIVHSTYFVVVDRVGRMRAFHDGLDVKSRRNVAEAVKSLLAELLEP